MVCTVNNFTSDEMNKFDYSDGNVYKSQERYDAVVSSLPRLVGSNIITNAQQLLSGKYGFMCQYENELEFETVWSSIFDLNTLCIYRAEGSPNKTKFQTDTRLCK